ncbi:MAG: hypothetical protein U0894_00510 [Pirellulales bacterium]
MSEADTAIPSSNAKRAGACKGSSGVKKAVTITVSKNIKAE